MTPEAWATNKAKYKIRSMADDHDQEDQEDQEDQKTDTDGKLEEADKVKVLNETLEIDNQGSSTEEVVNNLDGEDDGKEEDKNEKAELNAVEDGCVPDMQQRLCTQLRAASTVT